MNFIESVTTCLTKYFTFDGVASRSEFWWFQLFYYIVWILGVLLDGNLENYLDSEMGYFEVISTLIFTIPAIAVGCRRLHDVGRSGWWQLIAFTIIGLIPLIYWYCIPSNEKKYTLIPRWAKYFLVSISSILIIVVILGLLTTTPLLPSTEIQKGSEISKGNKIQLINNKIINKNDNILYFYSDALWSILETGQLITDNKIIVYGKDEEGLTEVYAIKFKNIKEVILEEEGSYFDNAVYKIIGNENAENEYIRIWLSTEGNKDEDFINEVYKKMNN